MDLAQSLVRSVVRSFYDAKHILVIDALVIHSCLRDDDMAYLMGINTKELHKLCGRLREERFLSIHTRSETKEGQQRPISRTYYYINYRSTIDAIKWRVYCIDKTVQGTTVPRDERKEYFCPRCKSRWTQMQVLDKMDMVHGFLCHKCEFPLIQSTEGDEGGHEQSTKLNAQFKFITDLLPKIDQVVVPDNTFEVALAARRPVIRDQNLNPANDTQPVDPRENKPTAVKGLTNTGPTSIAVTLTTEDGPSAAEKAAEQARKDALAAQNALPAHFTHSTVTGEQVIPTATPAIRLPSVQDTKDGDKKEVNRTPTPSQGDGTEIDDYFARLKAEQEREALKEQEEEYETDDGEEEQFEEVPSGTPASTSGGPAAGLPSALKRPSASGSNSGTSTSVNSPVTGPGTPGGEERASKRVRIEEPAAAAKKEEEDSEEDEGVEFEDV